MKTFHGLLLALSLMMVHCKPTQISSSKPALENTHWRLAEMNGNPIVTLEGNRDVYITLATEQGEKRISGFAGCNQIAGSYTLSGEKVKFVVASTRMMCPEEQMAVEDFLLKALSNATSFKIDDDVLELLDDQTSLATFKAIAG